MQARFLSRAALPLLAVAGLMTAHGAAAQSSRYVIPANTVIRAELDQTISSRSARTGDPVTARLSPEDRSGLPDGTRFEGTLTEVRQASRDEPAVLDVQFRRVLLPNGPSMSINGDLASLSEEDVRRTEDGRLESRRRSGGGRQFDWKWVGYGAGGGAILGQIFGGNLLRGALLGGLGGAIYGYLNRDKDRGEFKDVELARGTEFGIRLQDRLAFEDRSTYRYAGTRTFPPDRVRAERTADFQETRVLGNREEWRFGTANVRLNGRPLAFTDARPVTVNGILYVPLEPIAREANIPFQHRLGDETFSLRGREGVIRGYTGEDALTVRGPHVTEALTQAPILVNGEVYVPAEFLSRILGMRTDWNRRTLQLDLETAR